MATGTIVGYAYGMEFFIAWYGGNPTNYMRLKTGRLVRTGGVTGL